MIYRRRKCVISCEGYRTYKYYEIHSFIILQSALLVHSLSPKPLLAVRSIASSSYFQYPLFSVRLSSRCLLSLLRLPVTSIRPSLFPSITCFRRQFLCKMWPKQLAFLVAKYYYKIVCNFCDKLRVAKCVDGSGNIFVESEWIVVQVFLLSCTRLPLMSLDIPAE